jgi:Tol biopolymer transport system component
MPDGEAIVFTANTAVAVRQGEAVDWNSEIFCCRLDGSGLKNLTRHPGDDRSPFVTPDGRYLVFGSDRDARDRSYRTWDIYRLDLESGELVNLTRSASSEREFSLSPDGKHIVFVRDSGSKDGHYSTWTYVLDLVVMDIDGNNHIVVASETGAATWSSNSQKLAFYGRGTHIVDLAGENAVFDWGGFDPVWGHNDMSLYYGRAVGDRDGFWRINIGGSDDRQVIANINRSKSDMALDTSSGRMVIGASAGVQTLWSGIVVLDSLGNITADLRMEEGAHYDYSVCWSPDGEHIVFSRTSPGHYCTPEKCGIFIMSPDGSNLQQVLGIREIMDSETAKATTSHD